MTNLYEAAAVKSIHERLSRLSPDSQRQWGKMSAGQTAAHCAVGLEMALGDKKPPRMFLGRLLGWLAKPSALGEKPFAKNSPTSPEFIIPGERDLSRERERLRALIDRFAGAGPSGCTAHPHSFFGPLSPQEWSVLMYKHLDHHLRQFGV